MKSFVRDRDREDASELIAFFSVPVGTFKLEGALQSFTWAIQRAPNFASAYVARGTVYLAQGRLRLALADADTALAINPSIAAAHALRGETLRLLGRARRALEAFDQALTLDPALEPETFRSRWLAACATHDANLLLTLSREYATARPADPLRHYYSGWMLIESDRLYPAIRILVKGIDKQQVGQVAAILRGYRPPEPYKGKGVRYADEHVVRKEAKKK